MNIAERLTDLVGSTPLLRLHNYEKTSGAQAQILAKLECMNPAGSAKDRAAASMIEEAEKKGVLKPGATIVEPTSGNTGIALAAIGTSKGYRVILTMPETMSAERRQLLKAYGAEIVLTSGKDGMAGAVSESEKICRETPGAVILGQFDNPDNPLAHYRTTGPEIWRGTDKKVDIFVAGIGTGGTVSGVGKYLKEQNPNVKIVGVEPFSSPLITQGKAGPHKIQGIGANFIPKNFDRSVCDEVITISNEDALQTGKCIARTEGILVGISSGAAVKAAQLLSLRPENKGKMIVALLPDGGERYMSTGIFDD